jgi:hypothetical protein
MADSKSDWMTAERVATDLGILRHAIADEEVQRHSPSLISFCRDAIATGDDLRIVQTASLVRTARAMWAQKNEIERSAWLPLAAERAELEQQLSDPDSPIERPSDLIDELITVDMAMGPLRKAMGTAKTLADTLREQGWKVNERSEGGCVITGAKPQSDSDTGMDHKKNGD